MNDNENIINNETENTPDTDYIAVIQELRQNTVSKDDYNKLKDENKKLFNALATNQKIEVEAPPHKELNELRADVRNAETTLDGIKASLALRDEVKRLTGEDVFVPKGSKVIATDEDIATAERVASTLQGLVDDAEGDPEIFAKELQRIMVDTIPVRRR